MTLLRLFRLDGPIDYLSSRPAVVWRSPEVELAGWGEAHRIDPGSGIDRFQRASDQLRFFFARSDIDNPDQLPGPLAIGSFTFDARSSDSIVVVPEILVAHTVEGWWAMSVGDVALDRYLRGYVEAPSTSDRPRYAGSSVPDLRWMEAVAEALRRIGQGALVKVVLARDLALWSKEPFDPHRIIARLIDRFPQCFIFMIEDLVGASPELLVRRQGSLVESVALAGSARRSTDPEEDERIGKELIGSVKDLHEHDLTAASVGGVLGEVCRSLARSEVEIAQFDNVQHLATRFTGVLADQLSSLQLAARLHPTAAVGGTPTNVAIDLIRSLEGMDRGRYAGPVGWVGADGDGEWAIALRCAELSGARARLFAGAGVVEGSLPESELEETRIKLQAMMSALGA